MNKYIDMFSIGSFVFGILLYVNNISLLDTLYFLICLELIQYILSKNTFIRKFWNNIETKVSYGINNKLNTRYNNNITIMNNLSDIMVGILGWFVTSIIIGKKNKKKILTLFNV